VRQAIVVLGAGASFDCVSDQVSSVPEFLPPLVTGLFDKRYEEILNEYPLAEQLAPEIRRATSSGRQVALEAYLRDELLHSEHPDLRWRYHAIPLYLQHLLFEVSQQFTLHPDNYDSLIMEALRLDKVTFVTLNYDTLLDKRLAIDGQIEAMRDYIHVGRKWALVKLHGSVNWGRRLIRQDNSPFRYGGEPAAIGVRRRPETFAKYYAQRGEDFEVDREIELRPQESLTETRVHWSSAGTGGGLISPPTELAALYYPALAVPLGAEDETVCPDDHVEHVRQHQQLAPGGLNVLVIGYSGVDNEVRKLLAWGGRPLASLLVVNGTRESSLAAADALTRELKCDMTEEMAFPGGFDEFVRSGELARWFRSLPDTGGD